MRGRLFSSLKDPAVSAPARCAKGHTAGTDAGDFGAGPAMMVLLIVQRTARGLYAFFHPAPSARTITCTRYSRTPAEWARGFLNSRTSSARRHDFATNNETRFDAGEERARIPMRPPPCLVTARFRLRPRRREDIDAILQMDLDPEVYRYSEMLPSLPLENPDPAALREKIRFQIKSGSPRDFWAVEWKDQPGLLGLAGLCENPAGGETNVLGFRFVRTAWGQGIAPEVAQAILDHAFRVLKYPAVVAFSRMENWRSRRVLEKIGMKQDTIVVIEPRSLLSAPRSSGPVKINNFLNIKCSNGIKYLGYRLDRRAHLDGIGPRTP